MVRDPRRRPPGRWQALPHASLHTAFAVPVTQTIRPARPADASGILAVVEDAFSYNGTRDAGEELAIVRETWAAQVQEGRSLIELVVDEDGAVVGHLQAAPGRLDGDPTPVAGVAPVCIATSHQRRGAGSALLGALVGAAEEAGWPLLVLLGDPAYYGRFGFEPAAPLGLTYLPAGDGNPYFQALQLPGFSAALRGNFSYCWEN
jgi:putative acetyltransferase